MLNPLAFKGLSNQFNMLNKQGNFCYTLNMLKTGYEPEEMGVKPQSVQP